MSLFRSVAGEGNLLPIRRKLILVLAAEAERRHVVRAGGQVARYASIGRDEKQVAVLAIEIMVPVAKHELGEDLGLYLRLGLFFVALLIARIVLAIGIDRRDEQDALAVWRPESTRSLGGDTGHLARLAGHRATGGVEILNPDLRSSPIARRLEHRSEERRVGKECRYRKSAV